MLDRPDLEARVCECYAVVKKEFDRLLPEHIKAVVSHSTPEFVPQTKKETSA